MLSCDDQDTLYVHYFGLAEKDKHADFKNTSGM